MKPTEPVKGQTALIANRVTEKDLRNWLSTQGFAGRSAKIQSLDLYAIKPPGWVQVFSFEIQVKRSSTDAQDDTSDEFKDRPWLNRCGLIYDDEREQTDSTKIWIFDNAEDQAAKLTEMSAGLIVRRSGDTHTGFLVLVAIFIGLFGTVFLIMWMIHHAN